MSEVLKEIKDLTDIELLEDIEYYLYNAQLKSPPFVDKTFDIIREYLKEWRKRLREVRKK